MIMCQYLLITLALCLFRVHRLRRMLDKRIRGGIWLMFVLMTNIGLIAYIHLYSNTTGRFVFGLPEAFVVLTVFVFGVTVANASFAWYYLGKPNIAKSFNPNPNTEQETMAASRTKKTEETK